MMQLRRNTGLSVPFPTPPLGAKDVVRVHAQEAAVLPPSGRPPRVKRLVDEGDMVAQGAPVACLRDAPDVRFVAPMPARVARITLMQGHRLSEIVLFRETQGDALRHDTSGSGTEAGLRRLMQNAGFWPRLRRRPFGGMPHPDERPAAIFVMATDSRPFAPDPQIALKGNEAMLARGLQALRLLTNGPVYLCGQSGSPMAGSTHIPGVKEITRGSRHPQGAVGLCVHDLFPAGLKTAVWDIHAEDLAALGILLETGVLPMVRLVSVGGSALRESRLLRTEIGVNLRGVTHRAVKPGPHVLMSGSPLDGRAAKWLAPGDRQVTVLPRKDPHPPQHWLVAALTRSASPKPMIPTSALDQAFGGMLPAAAFLRALSSGDDETAIKMGVLSLLEEDVSLADYVLGGEAHLRMLLRGMLDRIRKEYAA